MENNVFVCNWLIDAHKGGRRIDIQIYNIAYFVMTR